MSSGTSIPVLFGPNRWSVVRNFMVESVARLAVGSPSARRGSLSARLP